MEANGAKGRTVTLKLKFSDFSQITRARSLQVPVAGREACEAIVLDLLREAYPLKLSVRLIGFTMSGLGDEADDGQFRMDL